jgi:hypothetical protein
MWFGLHLGCVGGLCGAAAGGVSVSSFRTEARSLGKF